MTPQLVIHHLAEILRSLPDFGEDDLYAAMQAAGIPDKDADRAYKFTQIACGRLLLDGIVGRFSDEYFWLDGSGEIVASGRLQDEPFFAAATQLVSETPEPWIARLGSMSADVQTVNDMLQSGSEPGDLQTGPIVLFVENPTAAGMEKAHRLIAGQLKAGGQKKPWWRFWT